MKNITLLLLLSIFGLISACGSDSEDGTAVDPDTPVLAAIGDKTINQGGNFGFSIAATDQNAEDSLDFAMSAIGASPGGTANPATLGQDEGGPRSAYFSWTPGASTTGEYTLKFTVTDSSAKALSDSETITISVISTEAQGRVLYRDSCGSCHGFEGSNGSTITQLPGATGYTVAGLRDAISKIFMTDNITTVNFPDSQLSLIVDYFCSLSTTPTSCE